MMIVTHSKWDERYMDRAEQISKWSKDPEHQVGAVIADPLHRLVGEGYNGPPMFVRDEGFPEEILRLRSLHAELNAILHASKRNLKGCTMYIFPHPPCATCAAAIIQKQLSEVLYFQSQGDSLSNWTASIIEGRKMLSEAGILYRSFLG